MNIAHHQITVKIGEETPFYTRIFILGCLIALGCFYLGSWVFFKMHSTDFIVAGRQALLEQRRQAPVSYRLDTLLIFAGNQTSAAIPYQIRGWSHPEAWGAWTDGTEAELAMQLTPTLSHPLTVNTYIQSVLTSPEQPVQHIEIIANDHVIAQWLLQTNDLPANRTITIPTAVLNEKGILRLIFRIRNPVSPKALGISNDSRQLGIGIHQILITAKP